MFDEAADAYREALDLLPETSELLMRWVNSRARSLNILSAIFKAARLRDAAARALEIDPLNVEARGALAAYYEVLPGIVGGDKAKASRLVEELVALSPADGNTLLALHAQQKEEPDSVKVRYLELALEADPAHKGALIQMGLHWIDKESFEVGLEYYERAAQSDPQDPQVWLSYARAYRRMGEADRSAELFRKTLEVDPYFAPARLNLAEYYEADGQATEALRNYTRLAINNPTYETKEVGKRIRRLSR
jgi:tetratricopeptide (TPR) repeat protein